MNELTNVLKIVNIAFRTVKFMEIAKKIIIVCAIGLGCFFAIKFWRNR